MIGFGITCRDIISIHGPVSEALMCFNKILMLISSQGWMIHLYIWVLLILLEKSPFFLYILFKFEIWCFNK